VFGVSLSGAARRVLLVLVVAALVVTASASASSAATGIDVSSWNHPGGAGIDWGAVRAAGHTFAFVKADEGPMSTGGSYYNNPYFAQDWHGAASVGMYRGAYHYARPKLPLSTAIDDARHFVSVTGTMRGPRDLPPVLDLESSGGLSGPNIVEWARTWLHEVERLTGRRPIIYTGYYFWKDTLGSTSALSSWRLWLPWYTSASAPGAVPAPWGTWTFWQYTETGSVPGIVGNTDINRYCCSDANLAALADGGGSVGASNPFGSLDGVVRSPTALTLWGWAIDPDTTNPIKMHVYVNGAFKGEISANQDRSDVGGAYPGFGPKHGFSMNVPAGGGSQNVCVYAMNVGAGNANSLLGCQTVQPNPVGSIDPVTTEPGGVVRVKGWAVDPDSSSPIDVAVFLNGHPWTVTRADQSRPDVKSAFGLPSDKHGFSTPIWGLDGRHTVCAWGVNVGPGTHGFLGCQAINVDNVPFGAFDVADVGDTGIDVRGWAIDPETSAPIDMHVYVDGRFAGTTKANTSRPDVGTAFPGYGNNHGFAHLVPNVTNARHTVCVYAINVGKGWGNPMFGCKSVNPRNQPFGSFDSLSSTGSGVRARGWAIDPDTSAPIDVHLYVDGAPTVVTADGNRPDVESGFPGYGPNHGFDKVLAASPGTHNVCAWAINVSTGLGHVLLGCRSVTV
jgi:GH25 family lysozyme M1 (1,4-beta-N-acetylmuramidase)